jgi:hypothetical protein
MEVDVVSSEVQRFAQKHKDSTIMRTLRPYSSWTTRAQCAEKKKKKTFRASLSVNVKAETVLVQVLV